MSPSKVVAFRPDYPPRQLVERFPGEESKIDALWSRHRELREICRDYREAVATLRISREAWASEERKRQIADLVAELEMEMFALVNQYL